MLTSQLIFESDYHDIDTPFWHQKNKVNFIIIGMAWALAIIILCCSDGPIWVRILARLLFSPTLVSALSTPLRNSICFILTPEQDRMQLSDIRRYFDNKTILFNCKYTFAINVFIRNWSERYYPKQRHLAGAVLATFFFPYARNGKSFSRTRIRLFEMTPSFAPCAIERKKKHLYFENNICTIFPELKNFTFTDATTFDDIMTHLNGAPIPQSTDAQNIAQKSEPIMTDDDDFDDDDVELFYSKELKRTKRYVRYTFCFITLIFYIWVVLGIEFFMRDAFLLRFSMV